MLSLPPDLAQQVTIALVEDIGSGDVTAELVPADPRVTGNVISREPAILCGRPWVTEVFRQLEIKVSPELIFKLDESLEKGQKVLATIREAIAEDKAAAEGSSEEAVRTDKKGTE